jgi:hypothetical protein
MAEPISRRRCPGPRRARRSRSNASMSSGGCSLVVTTVHELQVRPAGEVPTTDHDVRLDLIVTPDRVIDCRAPGRRRGSPPTRPAATSPRSSTHAAASRPPSGASESAS